MSPLHRMLAAPLFAVAATALAGGQATLETTGKGAGTMSLSWSDSRTVRMAPEGQPAYMLVRGGKAYSISNAGGRLMVMDMSSMAGMMPRQDAMPQQQSGTVADARAVSSIESTGETEAVAGIEGEVYEITWTDASGRQHVDEAVLSEDDTAVEMTAAFRAFAEAMGGAGSTDAIGRRLSATGKGLLRFSDNFRVAAISSETPPAGEFELPAEPMDMRKMMQGAPGM